MTRSARGEALSADMDRRKAARSEQQAVLNDTGDAPAGPRADDLFELPPELAIDTDVARRVIEEFIRGQLRQAGFERAVVALSGGIDSALVAHLTAEAIGADRLLCVKMPYATKGNTASLDRLEDLLGELAGAKA